MKEATMQLHAQKSQRRFWTTLSDCPDVNPWPIRDLDEWLRVTPLRTGFACQVIWRERTHCSYRHHNARTPQEAAAFARSLMRDLGRKLYDLGVTSNQPIQHTEFAPAGAAH
jgi:hypothetical protein